MVEEGVVYHAEDRDALVDQAQRDARVGEAVHEVSRPVCGAAVGRSCRGVRIGTAYRWGQRRTSGRS